MFAVVYLRTAFHKYCVHLFMTYFRASGWVVIAFIDSGEVIAVRVMKYDTSYS